MKYHLVSFHDCNRQCEIVNSETLEEYKKQHIWSTYSHGYDSIEDLLNSDDISDQKCSCCDAYYKTSYIEPTKSEMLKNNMCFTCNLWSKRGISSRNIIVGNVYYTISPDLPQSYTGFRGFGGSKFIFQIHKTGEYVVSSNVWHGGHIPDRFKHLYPENARQLTYKEIEEYEKGKR